MAFELSPSQNVSVNSEAVIASNGFQTPDYDYEDSETMTQLSRSLSLRSYNKWSPSQTGVTLAFQDVNVYAMKANRKKFKRIINNVTGALTSGSLVALMGSSGAGKSTLMSALAYRNAGELLSVFLVSSKKILRTIFLIKIRFFWQKRNRKGQNH